MSTLHLVTQALNEAADLWVCDKLPDPDALYSTTGNEFLHLAESCYLEAVQRRRKQVERQEGPRLPREGWVVYQLIDTLGRVIYVGMTGRPKARIREHIREFGERISHVDFQRFGSRTEAYDAETALIALLKPPMNLAKVPT